MSFRVGFDVSEENTGTPGPVPVRLIFAGNEIVTPLFGGFEEKGADQVRPSPLLRIVPSITMQSCIVSRIEGGVVCEWIGAGVHVAIGAIGICCDPALTVTAVRTDRSWRATERGAIAMMLAGR